ncbi:HAD-like protein, partial [Atractiella rhizophila]
SEAEAEAERFELNIIRFGSPPHSLRLQVIQGAAEAVKACSAGKWAVCTSGTTKYASAALQAVGLPKPDVFVTADTVAQGKPNPDPYLQGASSLSLSASSCIAGVAVEDAPNGVRSGKAAGTKVLALVTRHLREEVKEAGGDWVVDDLSK